MTSACRKTVSALKDKAAERFISWLTRDSQGPNLDNLARQSITVRFGELLKEGPTVSIRVDIEIILTPSDERDSLILDCH